MNHLHTIDSGKLTLPQKMILRKWTNLLSSAGKHIIVIYFADGKSTEYDKIYANLIKKNRLAMFSRVKVQTGTLKTYNFLDIRSVPTFVFYQHKVKLAQLSGHGLTQNVLQKYIDNIMYRSDEMGIRLK